VQKFLGEIHGLVLTTCGTGLVLITLSGSTRTWGIWITLIGTAIHLVGAALKKDENE
jgi:hypothetical protein